MRDSYRPNENIDESVQRATSKALRQTGVVDGVNDDGTVRVRLSESSHVVCDVAMPVVGDDYVPTVDDTVMVVQRAGSIPTVVGSAITDEKRTTVAGERIIGHPASDSKLHFQADGTLTITPSDVNAPAITIDEDGVHFPNEEIITDIETETDGDGHVTSVTPRYTSTLSL